MKKSLLAAVLVAAATMGLAFGADKGKTVQFGRYYEDKAGKKLTPIEWTVLDEKDGRTSFLRNKILQKLPNITIHAKALLFNFFWNCCLSLVYADVGRLWICIGHLPERIFYDSWSVAANAKLQKNNASVFVLIQKILIA